MSPIINNNNIVVQISVNPRPITFSMLQLNVTVTPNFTWDKNIHGKGALRYYYCNHIIFHIVVILSA